VEALNAYQPELLITYPSYVRRLVEEQEAGRLRIRPGRISSTAEVLVPEVRDLAKRTWGARVLNSYGTTEAGLLGTECDAVAGVHVAEDLVVLEVVDEENRAVGTGTAGSKVLVTTLFNRTFPLIRYELSDIAVMAEGPCACGRPYARVASIGGRSEDYLELRARGGRYIRVHAGRLGGPLAGVGGLRQYQIVPHVGVLRLRESVRDGDDPERVVAAAEALVRKALHRAGADVDVTAEIVDAIDRAGTGAKEKLVARAS
jgi:phenylacetate-CoA ligase